MPACPISQRDSGWAFVSTQSVVLLYVRLDDANILLAAARNRGIPFSGVTVYSEGCWAAESEAGIDRADTELPGEAGTLPPKRHDSNRRTHFQRLSLYRAWPGPRIPIFPGHPSGPGRGGVGAPAAVPVRLLLSPGQYHPLRSGRGALRHLRPADGPFRRHHHPTPEYAPDPGSHGYHGAFLREAHPGLLAAGDLHAPVRFLGMGGPAAGGARGAADDLAGRADGNGLVRAASGTAGGLCLRDRPYDHRRCAPDDHGRSARALVHAGARGLLEQLQAPGDTLGAAVLGDVRAGRADQRRHRPAAAGHCGGRVSGAGPVRAAPAAGRMAVPALRLPAAAAPCVRVGTGRARSAAGSWLAALPGDRRALASGHLADRWAGCERPHLVLGVYPGSAHRPVQRRG